MQDTPLVVSKNRILEILSATFQGTRKYDWTVELLCKQTHTRSGDGTRLKQPRLSVHWHLSEHPGDTPLSDLPKEKILAMTVKDDRFRDGQNDRFNRIEHKAGRELTDFSAQFAWEVLQDFTGRLGTWAKV